MRFAALVGLSLLCFSETASAATVHPNSVDIILTEGGRTTTIDGADIAGNAVVAGNPDIQRHYIDGSPETTSYLLSGQLDDSDMDRWIFRGITGLFDFTLINYAASAANSGSAFSGLFSMTIDGINVGSVTLGGTAGQTVSNPFGTFALDNANILIEARGVSGTSDYDLSVEIATTPLPASAVLLGAGLFGMGALMRRRARATAT